MFYSLDSFCKWLFSKKHKGYTVIAHYGKGYDFQFIQDWLITHSEKIKPHVIYNGQKILQLTVHSDYNIRFIDSISFIPMPLRDFPKTFGLEELSKGYFPHEFNTDENQNYSGSYPDKKYYGYKIMTKKNKVDFDKWYESIQGKTFNFKEQMYKYCKSDVDILRRGCIQLMKLFLEIAGIDPFKYVTIASVCNAIYRIKFLNPDTIAVVNEAPHETYSIKSIKWLKYVSIQNNIDIKHACHGGEQSIKLSTGKIIKVDGYHQDSNTVYQFHGCYYHGCPKCYDNFTVNEKNTIHMHILHENTLRIEDLIKSLGYNLVTMWEHEFDRNKDMKSIKLLERDLIEPPRIRDAFYGGRCEPVKLLHNFNEHQKGRYIDVVSLYPTVIYYDTYPIGHPDKIVKPKHYDPKWFGFIYCKMLPARNLYHPVLPYKQKAKQGHKLLFGLCRSCMNNISIPSTHANNVKCQAECTDSNCDNCKIARKVAKQKCIQCHDLRNSQCKHTDEDRCITGFWCTNEIAKAIEKGYTLMDIYEVWHFERTSTELFKEYIRKFLKIKLETSNFDCSEDEYRNKEREFGIELGKLEYNPGLRFISKLCLNSLWGKFGQVPKYTQHKYIDTEYEFNRIILDDKIENIVLAFINDNTVYVSYDEKRDGELCSYNTNIYIACFTTSSARLRLYDMIDRIGRNVCYMDTDSVVYIEDETNKYIAEKYIGDSLGEWTDELGNKYIEFWACAQSKDYGYMLNDGTYKGKVKGYRLTAETEAKMTYQARVDLITGAISNIDINYSQFNIEQSKIFTKQMIKQWSFQFDKRRIIQVNQDEIDTLPYGY